MNIGILHKKCELFNVVSGCENLPWLKGHSEHLGVVQQFSRKCNCKLLNVVSGCQHAPKALGQNEHLVVAV